MEVEILVQASLRKSIHSSLKFTSTGNQTWAGQIFLPLRIRNSYEHFVSFRGDVRDNDDGRSVKSLTYEVHPGAAAELATITNELAATGKINGIAIYHRSGELNIGDCALYVAVTAAHRKEAFELCSEAVNLVKERIPIWKHQFFTDGTDEWVNSA